MASTQMSATVHPKSADELKTADTVALLNTGIVDTGYIFCSLRRWRISVLVKGEQPKISWTPLENALKQAKAEENYAERLEDAF